MSQILTRRRLVAAAPAAVVAVSLPALAAGAHPDAALLALREPWRASCEAFDVALTVKGKIDGQVFAASRSYPDFKDWTGSFTEFSACCAAITAERKAMEAALGGDEAERLEDETCAANGAIVELIETTPARTLAGVAFKVEVSENECHGRPELIDSIFADVKALAIGGHDA